MKILTGKVLSLLLLCVFSLGVMADEKPVFTVDGAGVSGYDTVAYFTQGKAVKGDKSIQADYLGVQWFFSSQENKALFIANPEDYAPQYGGHCAYAMANGKLVSADPTAFTIVDNKLYVNYNQALRKRWVKDTPGYISEANSYWQEL